MTPAMTPAAPAEPLHVRILLATRNGDRFLPDQLASYAGQTWGDWSLTVGDDGSRDATRAVLDSFATAHPGRLSDVLDGPRAGAAANFLTLVAHAARQAPAAALAFSDQDDVWLPEKLDRAARWLTTHGAQEGRALVWVCRTVLTDARLRPIGESRRYRRPPGFGNALVQNILAGNTIVLSPAAAAALAATVPAALAAGVHHHDWWVYQVMTGIGAGIGMEDAPLVLYRQHERNLLGHHGPVRGRMHRLGTVARRDYTAWIDANLAALEACAALLTPEARALRDGFATARLAGPRALAAALPRLGLYRQTPGGDRMLQMIALAGRL